MKNLKSHLGLIAFVLVAVAATSFTYMVSVSSQTKSKTGDDVSISWSPKKREIKSVNSKFSLNLPESVSRTNWVVGVMPVENGENETIVVGAVSWKDSKMGQQTIIDNVVDLSDESVAVVSGQADLSRSTEFSSENGKSVLILLKTKPQTEVSVSKDGETLATKTFASESGILVQSEQIGMKAVGLKRITGVSSLLGELQTRKLSQRFGRKN